MEYPYLPIFNPFYIFQPNFNNGHDVKGVHHEKREKTNRNLGTKFQEVQRKWGGLVSPPPPPSGHSEGGIFSDNEDNLENYDLFRGDFYKPPRSPKFITGSSTVKCLTNRFDGTPNNKDLDSLEGLSLETTADILKQAVGEQRREIDHLKAQLVGKDVKIRQLEESLNRITGSGGCGGTSASSTSNSLGLIMDRGEMNSNSVS